jgi:hypothetical protein
LFCVVSGQVEHIFWVDGHGPHLLHGASQRFPSESGLKDGARLKARSCSYPPVQRQDSLPEGRIRVVEVVVCNTYRVIKHG